MTKMVIGAVEWYPVWAELSKGYGTEVSVDRKTAARWRKATEEFDQVQVEMKAALDAELSKTS